MILFWIGIVVSVALLGMTLREWMEFGRQTHRMKAEVQHTGKLVEDHSDSLAMSRAKLAEVKKETEALAVERGGIERDVMERRAQLTELEERLERAHPKNRRVDTDSQDGGILG